MHHLKDPLFRTIFDQLAEPRIILQPDSPDFTIVAANTAYLHATGYEAKAITGKSIWDFFKADGAGSSSIKIFQQGLEDVLRHKASTKLPIFRYDAQTGPRWWQVEILPVLDEAGKIIYLTCTTYNMTIHVQDQANIIESRRNEAAMLIRQAQVDKELAASEKNLHRALDQSESDYRFNRIVQATPSGLCILRGRGLVVDTINPPLLALWGKTEAQALGQPLIKLLPELEGQPIVQLMQQVLGDGKKRTLTEQAIVVIGTDERQETVYADFSVDALVNTNSQPDGVLVTFNNVTDLVNAKHLLQERQKRLEAMNEELETMNEELKAMNEELTVLRSEKQ